MEERTAGEGKGGRRKAGAPGAAAAWIATVPPDRAEGELAEVYGRIGARRQVARILGVQSLHPAGLEAHVALYRKLMFGPSPLDRAEREAIAVVVSALNGCFY